MDRLKRKLKKRMFLFYNRTKQVVFIDETTDVVHIISRNVMITLPISVFNKYVLCFIGLPGHNDEI